MSFAHSRSGPCGGLHTQHQPLRAQPCRQASSPARQIAVQAKKGVPDPPDTPKQERRGGREWMQTMLARFGPLAQKPENTAVLDFEKPLVELDNRIKEASDGLSLCTLSSQALWTHACTAIARRKLAPIVCLVLPYRYERWPRTTAWTCRIR